MNLKFLVLLNCSIPWFKTNMILLLKSLNMIMVENFLVKYFSIIAWVLELSMRPHVLIHRNKMELQSIRIVIFWVEAVVTAVCLINRLPSRVLQLKSPLDCLSSYFSLPSVLMLPPRVFGCVFFFIFINISGQTKTLCYSMCFSWIQNTSKRISMLWSKNPTSTHSHGCHICWDIIILVSHLFTSGESPNEDSSWIFYDWSGRDVNGEPSTVIHKEHGIEAENGVPGPTIYQEQEKYITRESVAEQHV